MLGEIGLGGVGKGCDEDYQDGLVRHCVIHMIIGLQLNITTWSMSTRLGKGIFILTLEIILTYTTGPGPVER